MHGIRAKVNAAGLFHAAEIGIDGDGVVGNPSESGTDSHTNSWRIFASHDEHRAALAGLKVGLRKRENDYLAGYRLAHAASSSGVFQSLPSADSLRSRPLNDSSSFFCRKKRAKS